jgi:hypothetical protein
MAEVDGIEPAAAGSLRPSAVKAEAATRSADNSRDELCSDVLTLRVEQGPSVHYHSSAGATAKVGHWSSPARVRRKSRFGAERSDLFAPRFRVPAATALAAGRWFD